MAVSCLKVIVAMADLHFVAALVLGFLVFTSSEGQLLRGSSKLCSTPSQLLAASEAK